MFYIFLLVFFSFLILLVLFNDLHFSRIEPILENGVQIILLDTFKMIYSVPMGELFVLLFILQFVKDAKNNIRYGLYGILFSGFILFMITLFNILVVGPEAMIFGLFPGMRVAKRIDIKQYIQRFDLIVANVFILHTLLKVFILLFVSKELITQIIPSIKKPKWIYIFLCTSLGISLFFIGKNYTLVMIFRQVIFIPYVNLVFELLIPFTLLFMTLIRFIFIKLLKK